VSDLPFILEVFGAFTPSQLQIKFDGSAPIRNAEINLLVEETWARIQHESTKIGINLFNGTLLKYLRHSTFHNRLSIDVTITDYANYIGTNYFNSHRGDEFGWEQYSNPLGVSANIVTSDGWLVYGRRGERVFTHRKYVHAFGGGLELNDVHVDGTVDAFAGIEREIMEELNLGHEDIEELICIGLVKAEPTKQPEIIFDSHVKCTKDALLARTGSAAFKSEHESIESCRNNHESLADFLVSANPIASVAIGAACLHGKRLFGDEWYNSMISRLMQATTDN